MSDQHKTVACLRCDTLFTLPPLQPGQQSRCPKCLKVYTVYRQNFLQRALAYVTAAGLCFIGAVSAQFISIQVSGIEQGITLAGGGALLRGIGPAISEAVGLPTRIAEDPLTAVARGTGVFLDNLSEVRSILDQAEEH